jgi:hypothetical protein
VVNNPVPVLEKRTFGSRFLWPMGIALGVWAGLDFLTGHLEWFGSGALYRPAAFGSYLLLGVLIAFGSFIIYPILFFRGASLRERVIGSYAVLLVWVFTEIFRVSEYFTAGESVYYAFSPMPFGLLVYQVGYMSLCEMICRWRLKKRGVRGIRIFTPGPLIGLGVLLAMVYLVILWGVPEESPGTKWFYIYQEGYKALFMGK